MSEVAVSPCRQICRLGADRVCDGCGRTIEEISVWYRMPLAERVAVMARVSDWRIRTDDERQSPGQAQPRSW